MSDAIHEALRRRTGSARREMVEDFFKPEVDENNATLAENREEPAPDAVHHPSHYKQFGVEVIDIIRHVLGPDGFRAYCIGNELKYRLRAGDKGDAAQDIAKAMKYREFRGCK